MTQWQFLIRKEGDQSWLPLESTNTEILEGRYQLVAELGAATIPVEVQLRHEFEQDGLFKQTLQHKLLVSDFQGQVDLTSTLYFAPGHWEVQCRISEQQEAPSIPTGLEPVTLSLQILARDYEFVEDWDISESLSTPAIAPQAELVNAGVGYPGLHRAIPTVQPNPADLRVSLPVIPKDLPPLELFTIETFSLPPALYDPACDVSLRPKELQLPCFPRIAPPSADPIDPDREIQLTSLRGFAKDVAYSRAAQKDFLNLSLQQRFLKTLFALAQSPLATSSMLVFQQILAAAFGKTDHIRPTENAPLSRDSDGKQHEIQVASPAIAFGDESINEEPEEFTPTEQDFEPVVEPSPHAQLLELPVPRLILSAGTLLADEAITILVRLPQSSEALQVKLWMNDRYTGDPLGEMTLLEDWTLNGGLGVLEATTQIMPPPGCFAIRFSAISVDPQTQVESGVVVVDRYIGIQN
jgi:hypothetical protein